MFDYNTMNVKVEPGGAPHWHVLNPISLTWWSWNACGKQAKIWDLPAVSTPQKLKNNTTAAKTESTVRATTCACCVVSSTLSPLPEAWGAAAVLLHQHNKSLNLRVSNTPKSYNNEDGPNPLRNKRCFQIQQWTQERAGEKSLLTVQHVELTSHGHSMAVTVNSCCFAKNEEILIQTH